MNFNRLLFYCLILLSPLTSYTQTTIQGIVTDVSNGEPLVGANLYLQSDLMNGTFTEVDGRFSLPVSGADTLHVSYMGYQNDWIKVDKNTTEIQIQLEPDAQILEVVEIKAKKIIAEEFATETLNKLDIYLNPNAKADALLAVQSLAASTTVDETANISLRGSPAFETGIFLNNVPVRDVVRLDQVNGLGRFSIFNTSMLESVTVFPSNPPMEFGNSTSGVVALNMEDDIPIKANSISFFLAGVGLNLSRPIGKKSGVTLFSNLSTHHGLKALNPNGLESLKNIGSADLGIYFIHHFSPNTRLKIFNHSILERYGFLFEHPSFTGNFNQRKRRNLSIVNFSQQWENSRLEINQSFNVSQSNYASGNFDYDILAVDHFSSINYHWYKENWSVKTGLALDGLSEQFNAETPLYYHALAPDHPTFEIDTFQRLSVPQAFVYGKYQWADWLTTGIGVRYYLGGKERGTYFDQQFNTSVQLSSFQKLTFSLGQYHKIGLPRGEFIQSILAISSNHYAVDYLYERDGLKFNAAVYHKMTRRPTTDNRIWGGEIAVDYKTGNFNGGFSLARIKSILSNGEIDWPSNYDLTYFFRGSLQYDIPDWFEISLIYLHRPGQYYQPVIGSLYHELTDTYIPEYATLSDRTRLDQYRLLDFSISKVFPAGAGSMVVFGSVNNLFDFKNIQRYNYIKDYSEKEPSYFSRRIFFMGAVYSF